MQFNIKNFLITMDTNKLYLFLHQSKSGIVSARDLVTNKTVTFNRKEVFMVEDFSIKVIIGNDETAKEEFIQLSDVFGMLQSHFANNPLPDMNDLKNDSLEYCLGRKMKRKFAIPFRAFRTVFGIFDETEFPAGNQLKVLKWYLHLVDIAKVTTIVSDSNTLVPETLGEVQPEGLESDLERKVIPAENLNESEIVEETTRICTSCKCECPESYFEKGESRCYLCDLDIKEYPERNNKFKTETNGI